MYRTTKKRLVRRAGISAAVVLGTLATGAGVASASASHVKGTSSAVAPNKSARASATNGARCAWGAGGVVSAVSSSSITVTDRSGTATTFAITATTTVTKDRASASISDLVVGDQVRIIPTAAGSTTAQSIDIEQPSVMGKVTAVSGDTISVAGPNGTSETVVASGSTTYTKSSASATLADVTVGASIFAQGTFASGSTTTLDATSVGIGVPLHQGKPGDGHHEGPGPQGGGFGPAPHFDHVK
jgi:hypothetical protein